ncbi:MAG: VOC family protein, partial [Armatimonadetes bacterium]|nr:VOC family protein [Armatimonadota bacterium]
MKLGQVILYVSDMGRSVEFYRDKLGLSVTYPDGGDLSGQPWVTLD